MPLNDTPQANQRINATQAPIRQNFSTIDTAWNINHVDFTLADQGKHKWVSMPRQAADPATPGTEIALYSKVGAVSAVTELFWRQQASGSVISLTEGAINNPGWTMLPSGLMLKWAQNVACGAGLASINPNALPFIGPNFSAILGAQITISNSNAAADSNTFVRFVDISAGPVVRVFSTQRTTTNNAAANANFLIFGTRA